MELKDKTIAFIINSMNVGGAAKMVRFVANYSVPYFKKVYFITLYDIQPNRELMNEVVSVNLGVRLNINKVKRRFLTVKSIRRAIKEIKPSIVCAFVSDVAYMSRFATLGLPLIFTSAERGDPSTEKLYSKILVKWAYKRSDACFFQLPEARDYFGLKVRNKAYVIPNAFPRKNSIAANFEKREKIIVSAGRFTKQKGYDVLIKAFRIVHESHPDYKLVLFGEGILYEQYNKQIKEYKLTESVEFPGYCENVPDAIKNASVFVLSSRWEGIPNSMIEAMSVGVPVVACDCPPGGPKYLSNNGERALIVPMDDEKKMAKAIIELIDNPEGAIAMAKRGLEILDLLDENVIGLKWIESFNLIIKNNE